MAFDINQYPGKGLRALFKSDHTKPKEQPKHNRPFVNMNLEDFENRRHHAPSPLIKGLRQAKMVW